MLLHSLSLALVHGAIKPPSLDRSLGVYQTECELAFSDWISQYSLWPEASQEISVEELASSAKKGDSRLAFLDRAVLRWFLFYVAQIGNGVEQDFEGLQKATGEALQPDSLKGTVPPRYSKIHKALGSYVECIQASTINTLLLETVNQMLIVAREHESKLYGGYEGFLPLIEPNSNSAISRIQMHTSKLSIHHLEKSRGKPVQKMSEIEQLELAEHFLLLITPNPFKVIYDEIIRVFHLYSNIEASRTRNKESPESLQRRLDLLKVAPDSVFAKEVLFSRDYSSKVKPYLESERMITGFPEAVLLNWLGDLIGEEESHFAEKERMELRQLHQNVVEFFESYGRPAANRTLLINNLPVGGERIFDANMLDHGMLLSVSKIDNFSFRAQLMNSGNGLTIDNETGKAPFIVEFSPLTADELESAEFFNNPTLPLNDFYAKLPWVKSIRLKGFVTKGQVGEFGCSISRWFLRAELILSNRLAKKLRFQLEIKAMQQVIFKQISMVITNQEYLGLQALCKSWLQSKLKKISNLIKSGKNLPEAEYMTLETTKVLEILRRPFYFGLDFAEEELLQLRAF